MGSKIEAKKMMAAAGVPVLAELDPATVTAAELPVLVKASAGGGGRGMRVVRELAELPAQVQAARREKPSPPSATRRCSASDTCPPATTSRCRCMADEHGTVWAVGERECSIQRRHQKIIEEAPSPLVERIPGMRERLFDAARLAAGAIGYAGAGTVEFLADDDGEFFFLEMNTRLQVEHPVTELTTGLDLVELQLSVADGERLGAAATRRARTFHRGAALRRGPRAQLAAAGRSGAPLRRAGVAREFGLFHGTGVRLDSGIVDSATVSIHYDPMLAKVISYAPTRRRAAQVLADALARARLHGVRTNRDLLVNVLRHNDFLDGATDTAFFDTQAGRVHRARWPTTGPYDSRRWPRRSPTPPTTGRRPPYRPRFPAAGAIWCRAISTRPTGIPPSRSTGCRIGTPAPVWCCPATTACRWCRPRPTRWSWPTRTEWPRPSTVSRYGTDVFVDSAFGAVALSVVPRFPEPSSVVEKGSLLAPMPGAVIRLGAALGDTVTAGQPLVWLEAMKMEHTITAPSDGVLPQLDVGVGQQVEVGTVLARVESPASAEGES